MSGFDIHAPNGATTRKWPPRGGLPHTTASGRGSLFPPRVISSSGDRSRCEKGGLSVADSTVRPLTHVLLPWGSGVRPRISHRPANNPARPRRWPDYTGPGTGGP